MIDNQVETFRPARLVLADGKVFEGIAFGATDGAGVRAVGEVVFNTSMYGYQEILTDPSYAGQIISFTYPQIGNVGCNEQDVESEKVHARGIVVRDVSRVGSNFRAQISLPTYLKNAGIVGIAHIDTRELVAHLRDHGSQMGSIGIVDRCSVDQQVDAARAEGSMEGKDFVSAVSCTQPYAWNGSPWSLERLQYGVANSLAGRPHVVAVDCGIKHNILRLLQEVGFRVTVVPARSTKDQILSHSPDALFLSNGPGDPATLSYVVNPVRELLGRLPMFGICLGHQILGQAFGGTTYKLKFGHRGGNHPVKDLTTGKVEITVQNHGFAVDEKSLLKKSDVRVSHTNLNDNTVEGLSAPGERAFCVQYHPESSPGPHDARYLFQRFFEMVAR